eukprot:SAG11_NODE_665_length_7847_cov_13.635132_9_plen_59_part_00
MEALPLIENLRLLERKVELSKELFNVFLRTSVRFASELKTFAPLFFLFDSRSSATSCS